MTGMFAACAVVFLGLTVSMALGLEELRGRAGLAQFAAGYGVVVASAGLLAGRGRIPDFLTVDRGQRPPGLGRRADPRGHASVLRLVRGARPIGRLAVAAGRGRLPVADLRPAEPRWPRTILSNGLVAVAAGGRGLDERPPPLARGAAPGRRSPRSALACCAAAFGARAVLKAAGVGGIDLRDGDLSAAIATLAGTLAAVIWTMTVLTSANRRLTREVSREKDRQMLLNRVLAISARSRDADEITAAAADAIGQTSGWSSVTVALPGEDGFFRFRGNAPDRPVSGRASTRASSGVRTRRGLTQLVTDVGSDPDYVVNSPETRSELAVPLRRNGRTLGVLNLESADTGASGADEVRRSPSPSRRRSASGSRTPGSSGPGTRSRT